MNRYMHAVDCGTAAPLGQWSAGWISSPLASYAVLDGQHLSSDIVNTSLVKHVKLQKSSHLVVLEWYAGNWAASSVAR